jgi:hypothetical protein
MFSGSARPTLPTRPLRISAIAFILVFVVVSGAFLSAADIKSLPEQYRTWLQHDVVYLITNEERDAFVRLTTDAERDKFIERFWEIRNPNPGAPANDYKQEIYSSFFGKYKFSDDLPKL